MCRQILSTREPFVGYQKENSELRLSGTSAFTCHNAHVVFLNSQLKCLLEKASSYRAASVIVHSFQD